MQISAFFPFFKSKPRHGQAAAAGQPKAKSEKAASDKSKGKAQEADKPAKAFDLNLSGPTMQLDGRASRTLNRLNKAIADFEAAAALKKMDFDDQPVLPAGMKEYKAACQTRVNALGALVKPAKEDIKKVERSTNKEAFEEQTDQLNRLVAMATVLQKLLTAMTGATIDPEEFLKMLDEFDSSNTMGLKLGPGFIMKSLMARANESCLHGDYRQFCKFLRMSNADLQHLADSLGMDKVKMYFSMEVETRLLAALRSITQAELELKASDKPATDAEVPNLHEACSLARSIASAQDDEDSQAESGDFVAADVCENASLVYSMLDQHDLEKLQRHTQKIQSSASEKLERLDAVLRFFLQHEVGKSLVGMATQRVETGEAEAEFQKAKADADLALELLEQVDTKGGLGIAAIKESVSPALEAVQEAQKCRFLKSKVAKKQELSNVIAEMQKRLSEASVKLLAAELESTLHEHLCLGG